MAGGRRRKLSLCSTSPSCRTNNTDSSSQVVVAPNQPQHRSSLCTGLFDKEGPGILEAHRDSFLVYLGRSHNAKGVSSNSCGNGKKLHDDSGDNDDDETASTVTSTSVDEEEDDTSSFQGSIPSSPMMNTSTVSTTRNSVRFCDPLVTAVYTRPVTGPDDKYYLHYSEHDYLDFKLDYLYGGTDRRCAHTASSRYYKRSARKVQFERDVVSTIHPVMDARQRQDCDLYYSEQELQTFLDDFVASLSSLRR